MNDCEEAIDRVDRRPRAQVARDVAERKREHRLSRVRARDRRRPARQGDPVHKVTIIPRGMALGITWSLPEEDRHQQTQEELLAQITMALGGRLAEEIKFGDVTTGAIERFRESDRTRAPRW